MVTRGRTTTHLPEAPEKKAIDSHQICRRSRWCVSLFLMCRAPCVCVCVPSCQSRLAVTVVVVAAAGIVVVIVAAAAASRRHCCRIIAVVVMVEPNP